MNIIEFACFAGLPSIVAFLFLIETPDSFRLAIAIGLGSAFVSLFTVFLFGFIYRLFRRRLPERAPVPIWAGIAVLLSASLALYLRLHVLDHKSPPNKSRGRVKSADVEIGNDPK
jgi:hypothetical protein